MEKSNENGQQVGYIRVSSAGQNTERQLSCIDLDIKFEDKITGKNIDRPKLKECLDYVRSGDTLHIHSMDRLARNLKDLKAIVDSLVDRGVIIRFFKENLTFRGDNSPMDNLLLHVMGAVGEFERSLIKERQLEGIQSAKLKGKHLGRHRQLTDDQVKQIQKLKKNNINVSEIARQFNISRQTVYNYL